MKYGMTDLEIEFLNLNLVGPLRNAGAKVWIFGSRATGKHQRFSDIDLLIEISESTPAFRRITQDALDRIKLSNYPYKIDLVMSNDLAATYRKSVWAERVEFSP